MDAAEIGQRHELAVAHAVGTPQRERAVVVLQRVGQVAEVLVGAADVVQRARLAARAPHLRAQGERPHEAIQSALEAPASREGDTGVARVVGRGPAVAEGLGEGGGSLERMKGWVEGPLAELRPAEAAESRGLARLVAQRGEQGKGLLHRFRSARVAQAGFDEAAVVEDQREAEAVVRLLEERCRRVQAGDRLAARLGRALIRQPYGFGHGVVCTYERRGPRPSPDASGCTWIR